MPAQMTAHTTDLLIAGIGAVALVLLAFYIYRREALLAWGIIAQFFLTIALPVIVLMILPVAALARLTTLDGRVWQALVAGLVIAVGWLTTAIFAELGKLRERNEKTRDVHRAIFSEIGNFLANIWDADALEAEAETILTRMRDDDSFVPFIPKERNDAVFNTLVGDIHILPRQTIDPVVSFYSQIHAISAMAEDMRGEVFPELAQDRRIAMYSDYIEMKKQAFSMGNYANALIDAFGKGGAAAADVAAKKFSNRAAVRSVPQSE